MIRIAVSPCSAPYFLIQCWRLLTSGMCLEMEIGGAGVGCGDGAREALVLPGRAGVACGSIATGFLSDRSVSVFVSVCSASLWPSSAHRPEQY